MNTAMLHYLAGIIDSRGYLNKKSFKNHGKTYWLYLFKITSSDEKFIREFKKVLKEIIPEEKIIVTKANGYKTIWITDKTVLLMFLKKMRSYVKVRKKQVEKMIKELERK